MWDFLSKMSEPAAVTIIIAVIIAVVIISLKGKLKAKVGDKEVDLGDKDTTDNLSAPSTALLTIKNKEIPHINCQYNGDFKRLMVKTIETMSQYDEMKYVKTLELQMSLVEEQEVVIKALYLSAFGQAVMKNTNNKDITGHEDYALYSDLITMCLELSVRKLFFHSFKQNRITKMGDSDFKAYVEGKTRVIYDTLSLFLDGHYNSSKMIVSREILRKEIAGIKDKISEYVTEVFYKSRKVAIEMEADMEELLDELDNYCETFGRDD
jgi:hypothetical protein